MGSHTSRLVMEPMGVRAARRGVYLWGAGAIALVGLVLGGALVPLHLLWALHVGAIGLLVGRGLISFRVAGCCRRRVASSFSR